jgi:hypothetical protein
MCLVLPLALLLATGCLSSVHEIPRQDLRQLANQDPNTRGQNVRVIQQFAGSEAPPRATPVRSGATVYVSAPVGRSHSRGRFPKPSASSKADDARWWLVVAAIVGISVAATEGARYDGWVELHPMHPVHIYGPYGEYNGMVPLAQLDPQTAARASKALVRPQEGPWRNLGRAPLDRQGFTYSLLLGTTELPSEIPDASGNLDERQGFMGHIQFGYFLSQEVGLQLDLASAWAQNRIDETIFDGRWAIELDYLPLSVEKLHGGVFGQGGVGTRLEDGLKASERSNSLLGGGAIAQLELTTRLTLTARAAATHVHGRTVSDFTVGISIY